MKGNSIRYTSHAKAALHIAAIVLLPWLSLACGGLSTDLPLNPTPLPLPEPRVVELETNVEISDFHNGEAVGLGEDGEVYLITVATGEVRPLTNDGHFKWGAVISADYVAWLDQRRELELPFNPNRFAAYAVDVLVLERTTGEVRRITEAPAARYALRIAGSRLVWQDDRNEGGKGPWEFDIYAYDLAGGKEIPTATAPGTQHWPEVHGDTAVWADNRSSVERDTSKLGCTNCADNPFDIYAFDFSRGAETLLYASGHNNYNPAVHGPYVVWQEFYETGKSRILLLDRTTGEQRTLGEGGRTEAMPTASEDYVVWSVREACDVVGSDADLVPTGVFAYNLEIGETRQLSNYVEPRAWLSKSDGGDNDGNTDTNVVLIQEGCHTIDRTYAVYLE